MHIYQDYLDLFVINLFYKTAHIHLNAHHEILTHERFYLYTAPLLNSKLYLERLFNQNINNTCINVHKICELNQFFVHLCVNNDDFQFSMLVYNKS